MDIFINSLSLFLHLLLCLSCIIGIVLLRKQKVFVWCLIATTIVVATFTAMKIDTILSHYNNGDISLYITIGLMLISIFTALRLFIGKKKPKLWNTPGGKSNGLYLELIKKNSLIVLGEKGSDRNHFRDSLIYTLLFHSPSSVQIVFISSNQTIFDRYKRLPHIKAYSLNHKKSFEILNAINGMVATRSKNENRNTPIYLIIDDYTDLVSKNRDYVYQINRLACCNDAACIRTWIFSSSYNFEDSLIVPNIHIGIAQQENKWTSSPGHFVYNTDHWGVYDIITVSDEDIAERILWWQKQHSRSEYDKLFDIRPDKTFYSYLYRMSPPPPDVSHLKVAEMTGLEYEAYVASRLKKMGYKNISVTSGSGDYGADVIAYDIKGNKTCFQCKKYQGSVGVSAVQEIIAAKTYYNCVKAIVVTTATFTNNAKKLAEKAGVSLIEHFY